MSDDKDVLIEVLKSKNQLLDKFKDVTSMYLEMIDLEQDDLTKAELFSIMVGTRDKIVLQVSALQKKITNNPELLVIYESSDADVTELINVFKTKKTELEEQQITVDKSGKDIEALMREEFRKLKEAKKVNTAYLDHGDLGGKFNYKQ